MPGTPQQRRNWLHTALIANLVVEVGIVVTGGIVRVTRSGLGCPADGWPKCTPDSFVPVHDQSEGFHKFIEFGNRTLTGVVSIAAVLVLIGILKFAKDRPQLRRIAWFPLAGVALQAIIGGITVRMKLSPITVSVHFLASMILVALSAYLLVRFQEGDGRPEPVVRREVRGLGLATAAIGAVILVLGTLVTGTGPHSGDKDVERYGFDLQSVSWLHADVVMLFCGMAIGMWVLSRVMSDDPKPAKAWGWVLAVTALQGVIGYTQYFLHLPEGLIILHMLGASLLVVSLTYGVLSLRRRV